MAVPKYLLEKEAPTTGYKKAATFLASIALVAVVVTIVVTTGTPMQELAKARKAQPLKFGASITLMTSYNEYITVDKSGSVTMNGFLGGDNVMKIISPKGKKSAIKYGDSVSLMGPNGKYFLARYSGKVTGRSTVIAKDSEWRIVGGSGGVQLGDRVSFKDEFGYLTVNEDGASSNANEITAMQKYLIGLPGQETGLRLANGLSYGEVVTFNNREMQYLQVDHNGWGTVRGHPQGNWDHFAVLSNEHREGHVSFGDRIVLRAHNGRFVSIRQDNQAMEAVSRAITDQSMFQILGTTSGASSGYVHSRDMVVLKGPSGYLEAVPQGDTVHAVAGPSGHYTPATEFQLKKVWDATL
jgi:hypothetical protein